MSAFEQMDEYLARLLQQEGNVSGNSSTSVRSRRRTGRVSAIVKFNLFFVAHSSRGAILFSFGG